MYRSVVGLFVPPPTLHQYCMNPTEFNWQHDEAGLFLRLNCLRQGLMSTSSCTVWAFSFLLSTSTYLIAAGIFNVGNSC